jgi:ABC-type branched-subunit amino acid transport system substrate-binding protein
VPARPSFTSWSRGVCVTVVAVALAGCGTTVAPQAADRGQPSDSARGGLSIPDAGSVVPGGSQPGSVTGQALSPSATGLLDGAALPRAGPTSRQRGIVRLGFFISDDASQVYKTLGISGASHSRKESEAIWQAVIDQVNVRGGLAGLRIVPSYFFIDSESGTNATRSQAACEQFAVDEKVFAVVIDGASDLSMASCLAEHRIPAIDVGQTSYPYDDEDLQALAPYLYLPGRLSMGRFDTYVDTLAAQGFFAKSSKVGLLRFDLPDQRRTRDAVIVPALRRHGLALTTDVAFTPVEGTSDLPQAANEASAAVLKMRTAGVDRVLFLGSGLSLPFVFPTVAESQGYRPHYGITSDDGPDFMATNAPAQQMTGAMAVGWEPQYDVPNSDAVLKANAVWRGCAQVMRKAGFTPRDGRRCTAIYFLEQALAGTRSVTVEALRDGVGSIGARPYSTQTYATLLRPGRFDGVSAVRALRFVAGCTCFRYATGNLPVASYAWS